MTVRVKNWHKFQHFKDRRPPWVKLYRDLLDDPDWHSLDPAASKVLVMLWLIASENDGNLPDVRKLSFRLRMKENALIQLLNELSHWLDQDDITTISDRYQVDAPETEGETETQEKTEIDSRTVAKATRPKTSEAFEEFWKAYPRRLGANPKAPAFKVFEAALKQGADPPAIIEGARRCAAADHDKIGTPYIPQAVKWLRDQRWNDYAAGPPGDSGLNEDQKAKLFEELRNGGSEKRTGLRAVSPSPRSVEGNGRPEPAAASDNPARNAGMVGLGTVFREPSGLRASGDEAGPDGIEQGNDGAVRTARVV